MQALSTLIAIAAAGFGVWWMLSVRSSLKAIQRKLEADPKHAEMQEARAQREAGRRRI